jgi:hypothetical protein
MKEAPVAFIEFELYRVRLEKPAQGDFLFEFPDRRRVLDMALSSKPSMESQQTVKWHIGNVDRGSPNWIHFLLGKSSLRKKEGGFRILANKFERYRGGEFF